jgi:hypothetical protein
MTSLVVVGTFLGDQVTKVAKKSLAGDIFKAVPKHFGFRDLNGVNISAIFQKGICSL